MEVDAIEFLRDPSSITEYQDDRIEFSKIFPFSVACDTIRSNAFCSQETNLFGYDIYVYKVRCSPEGPARYLLKYYNYVGPYTVWLRLDGYTMNDMHFLFDHLLYKRGWRRKNMLKNILEEWQQNSALFSEVSIDCLIRTYNRDEYLYRCQNPVKYWYRNVGTIGFQPIDFENVGSYRSFLPLRGDFIYSE